MEEHGRRGYDSELADRRRWQGEPGRRIYRAAVRRLHRLCGICLRHSESTDICRHDQPSRQAGAATYILLRKDNPADQNHEVLKFFEWALKDGQADAKKLEYVPLPPSVIKQIEAHWSKTLGDAWKTASAR
jgi:hypothetical protein